MRAFRRSRRRWTAFAATAAAPTSSATAGNKLFSPRVQRFFGAAASGLFPFGFGRKAFAVPLAVRVRIVPADVVNRIFFLAWVYS